MCRFFKKVIFVYKMMMPSNKRFTNRFTWSVLEIRSPHFYPRPSHAWTVRKRSGFVFPEYRPSNRVSKSLISTPVAGAFLSLLNNRILFNIQAPELCDLVSSFILIDSWERPRPLLERFNPITWGGRGVGEFFDPDNQITERNSKTAQSCSSKILSISHILAEF